MAKPHDIAGVILAGGQATRMGGANKAHIQLGGKPLINHIVARMAPQVTCLLISANDDPASYAEFGLPVLADLTTGHAGPLAGIEAAMHWLAANAPAVKWLVSVPVDTPIVPCDLVRRLVRAGGPAIAASGGRTHPVVSLYPVALAPELAAHLAAGHRRAGGWARATKATRVEFSTTNGDPFANVNTPDDLRRLEQALSSRA